MSPMRWAPSCRVKRIIDAAHAHGAVVLVDGAQAVPHTAVDVRALGADFYAFSGHKLYGPTGIGVLYGREELLAAMPPWQGGGDMILTVSFEKTTYNELPWKFEAGTPNISGAVGLAAAMDYVEGLGLESRSPRTSSCLLQHADQRARRGFRASSSSARRRTRPRCCPSPWRACIRTIWAPSSMRKGSRCAPATTAPCR